MYKRQAIEAAHTAYDNLATDEKKALVYNLDKLEMCIRDSLCFFPLSMLTISNNAGPALAGYSVSPFASAAVIFTAIILICSLERSRSNEKQEICES